MEKKFKTKTFKNSNNLFSRTEYVDGKKHGLDVLYNPDGDVSRITEYRKGEKHGIETVHSMGDIVEVHLWEYDICISSRKYDVDTIVSELVSEDTVVTRRGDAVQ